LSTQFYAQKTHKILQTKNYKFNYINPDTGLLENTVQTIFQDSQGFMWYGTPNGLYKYDGYNFTAYRNDYNDPFSLSENSVTALFEDKEGLLWVGTGRNLNLLDRKTGKFHSYLNSYNEQKEANKNIRVNDIVQGENGIIWIATNNGLFEIIKNKEVPFSYTFKKIHQKIISTLGINALHKRDNGEILIGTKQGLKRILPRTQSKTLIKPSKNFHQIEQIKQFNGHTILSFYEDSNNVIWVGTHKGLFKIIYNKFSNTEIINRVHLKGYKKGIQNISSDDKGNIWFGTNNDGLFLLSTTNNKIKQFKNNPKQENSQLKSNSILDLYKDQSGILWIGTSRGGLSKLDLFKKNFIHFKRNSIESTSINDNIINSFYEESNQEVWVGTFNGGLNKLLYKDGEIFFKNIPLNNEKSVTEKVFSLCKDNFGYLWVATSSNGLYRLKVDKKNNVIEKTNFNVLNTNGNLTTNVINLLYKDKIGDIWMGSFVGSGLMKFRPKKSGNNLPLISKYNSNISSKYNLTSDKLTSIFEDKKGLLWVGTRGGLNKIYRDKKNEPSEIIQYVHKKNDLNSLSNNNVFTIQEDYSGTIWIGSFGGGISKIVNTEKEGKTSTHFVHFGEKEGLASNAVYGIIEDNNKNLWISTNNGISRFNIEKNNFRNYNISDGLQARNFRKFAFHKGPFGTLYFGGINGFNVFHPNNIVDYRSLPKTVITDLKIDNKPVKVSETISGEIILSNAINFTEQIELKYQNGSFSFDFASLHFVSPKQNKYAYMLEGYDDDWIYTDAKRRFVGYSNLNNGSYTFKVKSANKDSIWNDDYTQIKVKILPPFWKTWWMYFIYISIFLVLLAIYRNYIIEKEKYNTQIKLEKFENEKIKEVHNMKLQFFTNVSHEFKTPLTLILGPLEKLIASDKTSDSVKEMLVLMQRNANQLYKLIQQVLEFRKIENNELKLSVSKVDIVNFCKELTASFQVLANKKNITILFKSNQDEFIDWFDFDKLEKIFNNLMSNALKFTPKNGEISIKISVNKNNSRRQGLIDLTANNVEISVKDTGHGIPLDKLALIFKRFYQVNSLDGDHMGSGVGLALTKSLVELHNGEILVSSKIKKGTKFIVRLPIAVNYSNIDHKNNEFLAENEFIEDAIFELEHNKSPAQNDAKELTSNKLPLLLIVEDQKDMRTFIKSLLSETYEVIEADDGLEGKKMALENVPDLIISDVMMPNMNGKELCIELKNNEITNHIPIILLTAKSSMENRIAGIRTGADAYIPKPFNADFLTARIENLLETRELLRNKYKDQENDLNSEISGISSFDKQFIEKAEGIIEINLMNTEFNVIDLGDELAYSRMQLYRKLKSITSLSANEFIRSYRLKKAASLLKETEMNITEILYEVGFTNRSYFTKCFKLKYEKTPKEYRK
tara:strand:- start:1424 stop:5632 length:4209 start_codon:yes stop_codon:yes gene_type:complete